MCNSVYIYISADPDDSKGERVREDIITGLHCLVVLVAGRQLVFLLLGTTWRISLISQYLDVFSLFTGLTKYLVNLVSPKEV